MDFVTNVRNAAQQAAGFTRNVIEQTTYPCSKLASSPEKTKDFLKLVTSCIRMASLVDMEHFPKITGMVQGLDSVCGFITARSIVVKVHELSTGRGDFLKRLKIASLGVADVCGALKWFMSIGAIEKFSQITVIPPGGFTVFRLGTVRVFGHVLPRCLQPNLVIPAFAPTITSIQSVAAIIGGLSGLASNIQKVSRDGYSVDTVASIGNNIIGKVAGPILFSYGYTTYGMAALGCGAFCSLVRFFNELYRDNPGSSPAQVAVGASESDSSADQSFLFDGVQAQLSSS